MFSLQGELILAMTYGYQVCGRNDRLLDASKRANKLGAEENVLGNALINHIPLCMYAFLAHRQHVWLSAYLSVRHIPEWLPWFSYKPIIRLARELGKQVKYPPIQFVKESMVSDFIISINQYLKIARKHSPA
jgi:hypothetical protein